MSDILVCFHLEEWAKHLVLGEVIDLDMWRESLCALGATGIVVIREANATQHAIFNAADKTDFYPPATFNEFATQEQAERAFPAHQWVYMDPRGELPLTDLQHPTSNVVYSFGPDSSGFRPSHIDDGVSIPTARNITMWALAAATCTLYDRMVRDGVIS